MRGPPYQPSAPTHPSRITPAYAGTTVRKTIRDLASEDHPRLCGDHQKFLRFEQKSEGSPPLMRGPLSSSSNGIFLVRITPAYAGTTCRPDSHHLTAVDHPRLCGDHRAFRDTGGYRIGITPAYAGTTPAGPPAVAWSWDHPRLCGDHNLAVRHSAAQQGSPPLMRGPPGLAEVLKYEERITPAYAGTTSPLCILYAISEDHPRLCGDHGPGPRSWSSVSGSPPLMRGPRPLYPSLL